MVATATPPDQTNGHSPHNVHEDGQELPIYDVLPPGLIDVPSAVKRYGCKNATLRRWIERGRLRAMGRLRGAAPGGGYLVISETELADWISAPRDKGGRPRKKQF